MLSYANSSSLPKASPHIVAHRNNPQKADENARVEQIAGCSTRERDFSEFVIVKLNDRQACVKNRDADNVSNYAFPMQTAKLMSECVEQKNDD